MLPTSMPAPGCTRTAPEYIHCAAFHNAFLPHHTSGRSAVWLARLVWDQKVGSSNLPAPTISMDASCPAMTNLPTTSHPQRLFADAMVEDIRRNGGRLNLNGLTIRLPEIFGFCGGVQSALALVEALVESRQQGRIFLLGELIHNPTVNRRLVEHGITILDEKQWLSVFTLATADDTIVIPAFGVPLELARELDKRHPQNRILDTTCGYVKRVWHFAERCAHERRTVVIHGKPDHPETRSTVSRALTANNAVVIVPDPQAAGRLAAFIENHTSATDHEPFTLLHPDRLSPKRLALANQTTMLFDETREIEARLNQAAQATGGELITCSTVCRATQQRQNAARQLCQEQPDIVLVVGGFSSSNTTQLCRIAEQYAPTYFVTDADAISTQLIEHCDIGKGEIVETRDWHPSTPATIAILAGASCPDSVVGDVIRKLTDLSGA